MRLRLSPHPPILIRHRIASGSDAGSAKISSYKSIAYPMQALITEEARNHFELGLPGGTGNGPARPVSFYGRFVLFRPLPSEGVIGGMRWYSHLSRHGPGRGTAIISAHMNNVPPSAVVEDRPPAMVRQEA